MRLMIEKEAIVLIGVEFLIGIDPGINNGIAIYSKKTRKLESVGTLPLFQIFQAFLDPKIFLIKSHIAVYIENPNTWLPFKGTKSDNSRLQGAGAVKQTYKHITEFLDFHKIPYTPVKLQGGLKKTKSDTFKNITGYLKPTNEHGRDAAFLVWNR